MRQAGVIAAAGIVALEEMVERLADDHRRARALAAGLHAINPALTDPGLVETNIVRIDTTGSGMDAKAWVDALAGKGIRAGAWTRISLRLVTHRHIDDAAVEETWPSFLSICRAPGNSRKVQQPADAPMLVRVEIQFDWQVAQIDRQQAWAAALLWAPSFSMACCTSQRSRASRRKGVAKTGNQTLERQSRAAV